MGQMGMSLDDFCRLDADEFGAIAEAWAQRETLAARQQWETARAIAVASITPHLRKGANATPHAIMPLPWDAEGKSEPQAPEPSPTSMTAEEQRRRMEELARQFGDKI